MNLNTMRQSAAKKLLKMAKRELRGSPGIPRFNAREP
jgi:hypothetical protein